MNRKGRASCGAGDWLRRLLFVALCGVVACGDSDDAPSTDALPIGAISIIPAPVSLEKGTGHLLLDASTAIAVERVADAEVGELLASALRVPTGLPLPVVIGGASPGDIALLNDESLAAEAYALEVDDRNASIRAADAAGLFYGCQTLRQLLPAEIEGGAPAPGIAWKLPMVRIADAPRFEWRGVMLDVARHFFPAVEVKRLIEIAAHYKLNRFHLHLTDDQGWRIHIESWPDLTAIGSRMDASGGVGGFYSQDEYADLVQFAAQRFVTIVPEIDMPGHTNAALASYGELNESGEPTALRPFVPIGSSSLWLEGEVTLRFVEDVLEEIAALTPGAYIHIGGDEAFSTEAELYDAFIVDVAAIVRRLGKTMIGWEEIGAAAITPPFVAQYWLSLPRAVSAHRHGASIISSPAFNAYLDMKYDRSTPIGLNWAGFTEVDDAYSWDPVPAGIPEADVLGVEAPLWSETVDSRDDIDLLMFPRLLGHGEVAWSQQSGREWGEYRDRLALHGPRLDAAGVAFYRSPQVAWPE